MPREAARKKPPVTPIAKVPRPFGAGSSEFPETSIGVHLRSAVPCRYTSTSVPGATQNDLPLSATLSRTVPVDGAVHDGEDPPGPGLCDCVLPDAHPATPRHTAMHQVPTQARFLIVCMTLGRRIDRYGSDHGAETFAAVPARAARSWITESAGLERTALIIDSTDTSVYGPKTLPSRVNRH